MTSPDNPTGYYYPLERQIELAHKALDLGISFVLFDWMYHWISEEKPYNINQVLESFSPEERSRLMFLDGLSKSMGGSNVRSAHLVASPDVCKFIVSRASHGVFPNFYSQAVAVVAYEMGFKKAAASTIEPTNASRKILRQKLEETGYRHIMGQGYYAFIDLRDWCDENTGSIELGEILARDYGIAIVPGAFFSEAGRNWVRFSYALPPERTQAAFDRFHESLTSLAKR
jgi:aminotransferase